MAAAAAEGTAALAMRAVLARAGRAAEQMVSVSVGTIELGALDCTVCYYPSRTGSSRTLLAFEGCRPSQFEYYSAEVGSYVNTSDVLKDSGSNKRLRSGPCGRWTSKACREKVRRDKLNDRFLELGTTPGKPVKADKAAIQSDDARMVTQLCAEAQQLKDTNGRLEENIEELKVPGSAVFQLSIPAVFQQISIQLRFWVQQLSTGADRGGRRRSSDEVGLHPWEQLRCRGPRGGPAVRRSSPPGEG